MSTNNLVDQSVPAINAGTVSHDGKALNKSCRVPAKDRRMQRNGGMSTDENGRMQNAGVENVEFGEKQLLIDCCLKSGRTALGPQTTYHIVETVLL